MKLSNLPPGVTDRMIEEQVGDMAKWNDDLMWSLCCAITDAQDNGDGRIYEDQLRAALKYHGLVVSWDPQELEDRKAQEEADSQLQAEWEEADRLAFERQHSWGKP